MKKPFRIATMAYLTLLGATLGAALYAGIVVAPVIFNAGDYLGEGVLSHYQEGLLMTQNFIGISTLVTATMIAVFLYESYKYKMFERDLPTMLWVLLHLMSGALFNWYYLPDIVTMQMAGEEMTRSGIFRNVHKAGEIDFKIFAAAILGLMVQNMRKACK